LIFDKNDVRFQTILSNKNITIFPDRHASNHRELHDTRAKDMDAAGGRGQSASSGDLGWRDGEIWSATSDLGWHAEGDLASHASGSGVR